MIKKQSGYYYYMDEPIQPQPQPQPSPISQPCQQKPKIPLQILGNVKQYIQQVAEQVCRIKQLKNKQKAEQMSNKLILDQLMPIVGGAEGKGKGMGVEEGEIRLEVGVPKEIYQLERRIAKLEQKIVNDEIVKQKIQRKGKLSERAKLLSAQIKKLSQKPVDTISSNIQAYCKNLQQKQQQHKALFLYETFTKTNAMSEQIQVLDTYLTNLSTIMMKFKALPPMTMIVDNHAKLLEKREKNRHTVQRLYKHMTEQYQLVMKEIDNL